MTTETLLQCIRERLSDLDYQKLDIIDDSAHHIGHKGAASGGLHFHLIITSTTLNALSRIEAHRAIYQRLNDLIPLPIHALQITLLRP